jgi:two-component system sensor histidine kinase/response regulator
VGGATAHGIGTWSMHYTGMLAFRLPVPVQYDWPTVLLSLLVSIPGSAAALVVLSRRTIGWPWALAGSIFLGGVGISGLHYTAMAAVSFRRSCELPDLSHAMSISSLGVLGISIVPVMVLAVALPTTEWRRVRGGGP